MPDYLRLDEVPRALAALGSKWRPLFATAIYTDSGAASSLGFTEGARRDLRAGRNGAGGARAGAETEVGKGWRLPPELVFESSSDATSVATRYQTHRRVFLLRSLALALRPQCAFRLLQDVRH